MMAMEDMWFMKNRTVFKYVLAHDEIGSDGWGGWGNVGDTELNMLTFQQICLIDMQNIAVNMLWKWDEDSEKLIKILALDYLEEEYRDKFSLPDWSILDGDFSREITPDIFIEEK